jgi:hypothetical protein
MPHNLRVPTISPVNHPTQTIDDAPPNPGFSPTKWQICECDRGRGERPDCGYGSACGIAEREVSADVSGEWERRNYADPSRYL